jgi:hypothetical protein
MLGYAIPSARSFAAFSRLPARWDHHNRNQSLAQFRASFFCCSLFLTECFISLCFTIPLRIPLQHFLWKVIRIRCFLFWWTEQRSSLVCRNRYLSTLSEYGEIQGSRSVVDKIWSLPVHDAVLIGKRLVLTYVLASTWTNYISFVSGC